MLGGNSFESNVALQGEVFAVVSKCIQVEMEPSIDNVLLMNQEWTCLSWPLFKEKLSSIAVVFRR